MGLKVSVRVIRKEMEGVSRWGQRPGTFIDSREAFAHPVTAAAELDPQPAVGGDDGIRQLVAAETPCAGRGARRLGGQRHHRLASQHHQHCLFEDPPFEVRKLQTTDSLKAA